MLTSPLNKLGLAIFITKNACQHRCRQYHRTSSSEIPLTHSYSYTIGLGQTRGASSCAPATHSMTSPCLRHRLFLSAASYLFLPHLLIRRHAKSLMSSLYIMTSCRLLNCVTLCHVPNVTARPSTTSVHISYFMTSTQCLAPSQPPPHPYPVSNLTTHPSTASVPIAVLVCCFNVSVN